MKILEPSEEQSVKYYSSISQHKNKLAVLIRGEWVPISFDVLDFIDCDKIGYHTAIVTDGDDIGFNYPVGECRLYIDQYVYHDEYGSELRTLPKWYGEGFYTQMLSGDAFINSDTNSLGVSNEYRLRVGLNYALADKTLPAVE